MNALEDFLAATGLPEVPAMNHLQSEGIISDECAWAFQVAPVDCAAAVMELEGKFPAYADSPNSSPNIL